MNLWGFEDVKVRYFRLEIRATFRKQFDESRDANPQLSHTLFATKGLETLGHENE